MRVIQADSGMKATAEIIDIRGRYAGKIDCADGTYIEVLIHDPVASPATVVEKIRFMASALNLRVTIKGLKKIPGMEDGRPSAFVEIDEAAKTSLAELERKAQARIENRIRRAENNRSCDQWLGREMRRAGGKS